MSNQLDQDSLSKLKSLLQSEHAANWPLAFEIMNAYAKTHVFPDRFLSFLSGLLLFAPEWTENYAKVGLTKAALLHFIRSQKEVFYQDIMRLNTRFTIYFRKHRYSSEGLYKKMNRLIESSSFDEGGLTEGIEMGVDSYSAYGWNVHFLLERNRMSWEKFKLMFVVKASGSKHHSLTITEAQLSKFPTNYLSRNEIISTLILRKNDFEVLPIEVYQYEALEDLYIYSNKFKILDAPSDAWPQLKHLTIQKCRFLRDVGANILQAPGLSYLELASCGLTQLPAAVYEAKALLRLILSGNKLRSISAAIGQLKELKQLVLEDNIRFKYLPKELFELKQLENLNLNSCDLNTLPEEMAQLQELRVLRLANNPITAFPEGFFSLRKLKILNLSKCKIPMTREVMDQLLALPDLKQLYLNYLPISKELYEEYVPKFQEKIRVFSYSISPNQFGPKTKRQVSKEETKNLIQLLKSEQVEHWKLALSILEGYEDAALDDYFLSFLAGFIVFAKKRILEMQKEKLATYKLLNIIARSNGEMARKVGILRGHVWSAVQKKQNNPQGLFPRIEQALARLTLEEAALCEALELDLSDNFTFGWNIWFLLQKGRLSQDQFESLFVSKDRYDNKVVLNLHAIQLTTNALNFIEKSRNFHRIYIPFNLFSSIPTFMYDQPLLENFMMNQNPILCLDLSLLKWPKLQTITIQDCKKWRRIKGNFGTLSHLERVSFVRCAIKEIPVALFSAKTVKILDLTANKIETIGKEIANMTNLEFLNLRDNVLLKSLPDELFRLKKLKKITLSNAQIEFLSEDIRHLESLTDLRLANNELRVLPKALFELKELKTLKLSHNKLKITKEIMEQFLAMPALHNLSLEGMQVDPKLIKYYMPLIRAKGKTGLI